MKATKFHEAACRLNVMIKGNVYGDLFAVDVCYHKRCYSLFTYTYQPTLEDANMKHTEDQLIDCFFRKIALNILEDKEAYLRTGLLQDIKKRVSNVDCRNHPED